MAEFWVCRSRVSSRASLVWVTLSGALLLACGGKSGSEASNGGASALSGGSGATAGSGTSTAKGGSGNSTSAGGSGGALGRGGAGGAVASSGGITSSAGTGNVANATGGVSTTVGGQAGTIVGGPPIATQKLDLLLMVDNSISMADKQEILASSLPALLTRLTQPRCLDSTGAPTGASADASGKCANGSPEFRPQRDIHIGLVTSSLGAHGGEVCADASGDDRGQLLPLVRPSTSVTTWNNSGFLAWDPGGVANPPGATDLAAFASNAEALLLSAGQTGCGYESQLEAWYRFLIDPDPIASVPAVTDATVTRPVYPSSAILMQRAAFLRPDSVVAVLMLSDENDCSIIDSGQGWLVGRATLSGTSFRMPAATSACASNPNDRCCTSCAATLSEPGCQNPADDANCKANKYLPALDDSLNLRCFDQQRRFGFDLLYPTQRYVDGLTRSAVMGRDLDTNGTPEVVPNPLFSGGKRSASMVFLAGIVGVPWQDLASTDSLTGPALSYLSFAELKAQGRWDLVLGSPGDAVTPPSPPGDKLMFETTADRTTLFGTAPHPLIGAAGALAPATTTTRPNQINGHETNNVSNYELQYSCIFQLPTSHVCTDQPGCDCQTADASANRALCDGTTQTYGKAYPGVRELTVLKAVGELTGNSVAASICAKSLNPADGEAAYFNPAMARLVDTMRPALN